MPRQLPPLNPLRTFAVSARHLNFTRAAEELCVTPAAVSHQIKTLEESLGVELLFIRDSEEEYENARSTDKDLVFIEGATHGFTPCANCGAPQSAYSNSAKNMFDYVRAWTVKRMN